MSNTSEALAKLFSLPGNKQTGLVGAILASAATIVPTNLIHHVSGTAEIDQITPPWVDFTGILILIPDAAFTYATGGTAGSAISKAGTAIANEPIIFVYDGAIWNPTKP